MGIERLLRKYRVGGGASRYHPEMMTKLFIYGIWIHDQSLFIPNV
jgi:transposase